MAISYRNTIATFLMASSFLLFNLRRGAVRAWHQPSTRRSVFGGRLRVPPSLQHCNHDDSRISSTHLLITKHSRLFLSTTATETTTTTTTKRSQKQTAEDKILYDELKSLSTEIRRHDDLYYNQNPVLSDDEFDALVQREDEIATNHPTILARWQKDSGFGVAATRSGRVGTAVAASTTTTTTTTTSRFIKRRHMHPMLSLDNVHNIEQLRAWLKRIQKAIGDNIDENDNNNNNNNNNNKTNKDEIPVTILTEPKLDGLSLSLRYQRDDDNNSKMYKLVWASTRGDGEQGQDVTAAIRSMNRTVIPEEFASTSEIDFNTIEVRGEVVMPKTTFSNLDAYIGNHTFSNARNAASGILLRKTADAEEDEAASRQLRSLLQFYSYDLVADEQPLLDGSQSRDWLTQWGFRIPMPIAETTLSVTNTTEEWTDDEISTMLTYHQSLADFRDNGTLSDEQYSWGDFEMDGCVHKVASASLRQALGRSMKSPKWAVAHKFPPMAAVSNLLDVSIQVGRTGALTPVAVLEPVQICGVSIQRATLHNFLHLQQILGDKTIPVGTPVLVRRAGDVIPQVVQRISVPEGGSDSDEKDGKKTDVISLEPPTHCPACNSPVVWEETAAKSANSNSTVGQVVRCGGPPLLCPPRAITSLAHAYSRDALDITGLSEARIEQLMEADLIRFPCDVFHFGESDWNATSELPGWGAKSCQNLRNAVGEVAEEGVSLGRFIYSLGIRHIGKHSSELVAESYGSVEAFLTALETAATWSDEGSNPAAEGEATSSETQDSANNIEVPFPELHGTLGIGPVLVNSLLAFSKSEDLVKAAKELARGIKITEQPVVANGETETENGGPGMSGDGRPLEGLRVVFTGSLPDFSRSEAQKAAKTLGAKSTPGSVSKSTDLVVYGEKGGKKLEQARAYGVRTMPAEEFFELLKPGQ